MATFKLYLEIDISNYSVMAVFIHTTVIFYSDYWNSPSNCFFFCLSFLPNTVNSLCSNHTDVLNTIMKGNNQKTKSCVGEDTKQPKLTYY